MINYIFFAPFVPTLPLYVKILRIVRLNFLIEQRPLEAFGRFPVSLVEMPHLVEQLMALQGGGNGNPGLLVNEA